jgi:hypothetical protein
MLVALCSALPNKDIDNGTLLEMAEILLNAGASTAQNIDIQFPSNMHFRLSLLHFVARVKRDEAWVSLMLRHDASLHEDEFTFVNQLVIRTSLRQTRYTCIMKDLVDDISGDAISGSCAIIGAVFAATVVGNLISFQALLDITARVRDRDE